MWKAWLKGRNKISSYVHLVFKLLKNINFYKTFYLSFQFQQHLWSTSTHFWHYQKLRLGWILHIPFHMTRRQFVWPLLYHQPKTNTESKYYSEAKYVVFQKGLKSFNSSGRNWHQITSTSNSFLHATADFCLWGIPISPNVARQLLILPCSKSARKAL